ncbi:hypothetical protein [Pedobacter aquatilis]|uniref:hypothetical protein n=1 Tax=Pedobacter aquatilis TaxID=351343 RepID=UPI00292CB8EF|nr:hypothetical protein [Pedobacter aquatilis]
MYEEKLTASKSCLQCGIALLGRIDKRFCDDYCRTTFNNRKRHEASVDEPYFLKEIPRVLLSNYKILKKLNHSQSTTVPRQVLERLKFNFHFITSYYKTRDGEIYSFCFDQGYLPIKGGDRVLLVTQASQVLI